jgi:hypothetical protein
MYNTDYLVLRFAQFHPRVILLDQHAFGQLVTVVQHSVRAGLFAEECLHPFSSFIPHIHSTDVLAPHSARKIVQALYSE